MGGVGADPTWPNRAGYSIPCAVMLGSGGGGGAAGTHSRLRRAQQWFGPGESGCVLLALFCWFVLCICLICIVVVAVPFVCCSVKLPLSQPTSFCLFLSILLRRPAGGGADTWHFCCWSQPNQNIKLAPRCGAAITAGLSSGC